MVRLSWDKRRECAGVDYCEIYLSQYELAYHGVTLVSLEFKIEIYYSGVWNVDPQISICYVSKSNGADYQEIRVPSSISSSPFAKDLCKDLCEQYLQDMLDTLYKESGN